MNSKTLVAYLKEQHAEEATFLDRIKIAYRPYLCPFDDILEAIPEKSSVFDVGCGSGMLLSLIGKFRNPIKLAGCEITEHLIENAKEVLSDFENKTLFVFNGDELPNEIMDFDIITMIDVLHHIPKEKQYSFLENLVQKMKLGSTLIFKDIRGESILSYWNKFHDLLLAGEIGNELKTNDVKHFFVDKLTLKLVKSNNRRMLLYPHFTLILKKVK